MISDDVPELIHNCNRLVMMHKGRFVEELPDRPNLGRRNKRQTQSVQIRHPLYENIAYPLEAVIGLILLSAMFLIGIVNPAFWELDNLFNLLKSNIIIGIMALGVLMVMISGGIDVSFPAIAVAECT